MFQRFGVPAVQVGEAFELPKEEEKIELATPELKKKEEENVSEKR